MKSTKIIALLLFCLSLFINDSKAQTYKVLNSISIPGDNKWDFASIDEATQRLFISHEDVVQVIDLKTEKLAGEIPNTPGVHGIAIANDLNRGYISCGENATVVVFDLTTLKAVTTIKVKGKDPDAILYDQPSHRVFAFCGDSHDIAVIDTKTNTVVGTIALSGTPEFAVIDGKGKIYDNIEDKNEMAVIDMATLKVERTLPLAPCTGPTGLAYDQNNNRLFTGCRGNKGLSVLDGATGKIIQTLPIGGVVDAVAFDAEKKLIFTSNGEGSLTIIKQEDADHYKVIQTLITQKGSKTMALDSTTHKVYVNAAEFTSAKKVVKGTFKVLVIGQ